MFFFFFYVYERTSAKKGGNPKKEEVASSSPFRLCDGSPIFVLCFTISKIFTGVFESFEKEAKKVCVIVSFLFVFASTLGKEVTSLSV